ncbi:MAG: type I pullulanase [Rikenellaceae bacterium]|nr:type I pullulanase [Rikenellaceae bacterium]
MCKFVVDEYTNKLSHTAMRLHTILQSGTLLLAAITFVSCGGCKPKSPKPKQESPKPVAEAAVVETHPVPEKPIEEMTYTPEKCHFELWAPTAERVVVRLYNGDLFAEELEMTQAEDGLWSADALGDKRGMYYAFQVTIDGKPLKETAGIFARALNVNGDRGAIINLDETDPKGWNNDKSPKVKPSETVIYEMHYRDMTAHASAGSANPGKYIAMAERGTRSFEGKSTGLDHLVEMGITHVHLLPTADFGSIDESRSSKEYNWGYEPKNYNTPEGTYATNVTKPETRIREFKSLVKALHDAGICVVLDVVYNHTTSVENCGFELTAPGYFYRMREDGSFANGSGCGNETASEKPMMRKYMVESLEYWVKEYHIDGFRFDLMAIHDIETMNLIKERLTALNPDILLYGEGWAAMDPLYDESKLAFKRYTYQMPGVAAFSDDIRNALRGALDLSIGGFVHGVAGNKEALKFGIVGGVEHPEVEHVEAAWCANPRQHISYVSCHDDHNLRDRLELLSPDADEEELLKMDKLAQFGVFTSQGVPFIFCGEEMFRTKQHEKNTYNMSDKYNAIDWSNKQTYGDLVEYYKGLIALRKAHPAFSLGDANLVRQHLRFIDNPNEAAVGFYLFDIEGIDSAKSIVVLMNGSRESVTFDIPVGDYKWVADGNTIVPNGMGNVTVNDGKFTVPPITGIILAEF